MITIKIKHPFSESTFLCTIEDDQIDAVIKQTIKEMNGYFGEETVNHEWEEVSEEVKDETPGLYKVYRVSGHDGDDYNVFLEFYKRSFEEAKGKKDDMLGMRKRRW